MDLTWNNAEGVTLSEKAALPGFRARDKGADESGGLLYTPRHYSTAKRVAFRNKWASGWCWMLAYAGANGACRVLRGRAGTAARSPRLKLQTDPRGCSTHLLSKRDTLFHGLQWFPLTTKLKQINTKFSPGGPLSVASSARQPPRSPLSWLHDGPRVTSLLLIPLPKERLRLLFGRLFRLICNVS